MVLAISRDRKGRSVVEPYKEQYRLTFPHLLDDRNKASRAFGVRAVPTTIIVNRRGHIIARAIGLRPWANPEFQRLFEELIAEE